jgi:DNA replication protein DnaC
LREHRERRRLDQIIESVPERLRWARLDAPELGPRVKDPRAVLKLRTALAANVDRLLLLGPAGIGKTSLATATLVEIARRRDVSGLFVDAYELAVARQHHALGSEAPLVARAMAADVLVLDDLGAERAIPSSPVGEVIHKRHATMRATVVTSGFGLDALEQRYGGGIFRRLTEDAEVIEMRAKGPTR